MPLLDDCLPILERTPVTLNAMLRGLPGPWLNATEGPSTWSPFDVLGHLVHGERHDWMVRAKIILQHGPDRPFDPFDREAMLRENSGRTADSLLDDFADARRRNLGDLRAFDLQPADLQREGEHPVLGRVTLHNLLSTWAAHDLAHLLQISRVMAKQLKTDVGPFAQFLSVMRPPA